MNTDTNTNTLILEDLAALIGGKAWSKGEMQRIYMPLRRKDAKVYFDFEDGIDGGAAMKVWIDDCGQSAKWYASQREMLRSKFTVAALALAAARGLGLAAAQKVMALESSLDSSKIDTLAELAANGNEQAFIALLAEVEGGAA